MFYRHWNQNGAIPVLTAEPKAGNISLSFAFFFPILNILSSTIAFLNYSVQLFKLAFVFAIQNNLLSPASFTVIFQMIHDQVRTHNLKKKSTTEYPLIRKSYSCPVSWVLSASTSMSSFIWFFPYFSVALPTVTSTWGRSPVSLKKGIKKKIT